MGAKNNNIDKSERLFKVGINKKLSEMSKQIRVRRRGWSGNCRSGGVGNLPMMMGIDGHGVRSW